MTENRKRLSRSIAALVAPMILLGVIALGSTTANAQASKHSEQVVFSGVGFAASQDWASPVGFWIWCEADSANPYVGRCSGAMYVYFQGITTGVNGTITENPDGIYHMDVTSNQGASVLHARLWNADAPVNGPRNGVAFVVDTPAGTAAGGTLTAVVKVTGP
jgi:hypothetical protein